jgi:4-amino-4-deoxy-L-arabinose transferase-like glycosyltransferase
VSTTLDAREAAVGARRRIGWLSMLPRIPTAAWLCAIVAGLSAVCWSLVTPAFQAPDEQDHYAYVAVLAQTGRPPTSSSEVSEPEELVALIGLHYLQLRHQPRNRAISTAAEQQALEQNLAAIRQRHFTQTSTGAGVASSEPPLYYALEVIPYSLASTILGRLPLMRLLSALMAAITALFAYLFVREALPRSPWAWIVGGLGVALVPLLGFVSGSVNPDSMLFAVSAVLFYCLARAFRRCLTGPLALATGAVIAVGLLTKLNFIGLVPGAIVGLVLLSVRAARVSGRSAYRSLALACVLAATPVALYAIVNALSNHAPLGIVSHTLGSAHPSLAELGYIWQLYLPRLPGMANDFPGLFTTRQLWFNGYVGLYGWFDTTFPGWVYNAALIPAGAIAALCVREFFVSRAVLRERLAELAVYALMAIGLMALVGAASYTAFPARSAEFAEARYLLPLLLLLAAVLALAARGACRRWGRAVGVTIVLLFFAHDIFSQLLVVSRFYG